MLEVELFGEELAPGAPGYEEVRELCELAAESRGVAAGHVAVEYVSASRIAELNGRHRGKPEPTDVLSFPIDGIESASEDGVEPGVGIGSGAGDRGVESDLGDRGFGFGSDDPSEPDQSPSRIGAGPLELGDIVICPAHTVDLREAIVHGMLHLLGMDHETDSGEMLALQDELMRRADS